MSIDFENSDQCKSERCTNFLTSQTEAKRGYCDLCNEQNRESVIYKITGNTYEIKEDLKARNCKWNTIEKCWVTPSLTTDEISYKQLTSITNAVGAYMIPVKLSGDCKKIQDILQGDK